jgi:CRP/FNR family transcriptional regulator
LRTYEDPWFASVEVVEDATLCILGAAKIDKLRLENPQFNIDLSAHANKEIAAAQAHLVTLGRRSPIERLAALLIEFNDRGMGVKDGSGEVRIPIGRDEIGDYIGLESETVSRQFTRLKSDGYVSLTSPSRVVVRDWHALQQLSNGESSIAAE